MPHRSHNRFSSPCRSSSPWLALLCFSVLLGVAPSGAQVWDTAATNPGNDAYYQPPYPLVFVAAEIRETTQAGGAIVGTQKSGADVLSANNPSGGHQLWILLPNGLVKKLFPLQTHVNQGLIDAPATTLTSGSVVEPSMSEDGTKVYFSYFHDADAKASQTFNPVAGADLYRLDLTSLVDDFNFDPANLTVQRLTSRTYLGNGYQDPTDWADTAMNEPLSQDTSLNNWGTVYMHAVEMRKEGRIKMVYVSNERRLRNSNRQMNSYGNHNFNLHMAEVNANGVLYDKRQFQYYTTTSALSPFRLRNGVGFSYQATTTDARNWHIQVLDSAGRWYPGIGYGTNPELFHLGTFCVDTEGADAGDYMVATRYYNQNNESFGALWKQDLSVLGINTYDDHTYWGTRPRQHGSTKITLNVSSNDDPSAKDGNGNYYGKMTTPRCGTADELYMAWSPTSANSRLFDPEGNKGIYHSKIVRRSNFDPFNPLDTPSVSAETGLPTVIDDTTNTYKLLYPTPVITWLERSGDAVQQSAPKVVDFASTVTPGLPHAQVGTSALWNTDRKPFDCWLSSNNWDPYSPNESSVNINQENDLIVNNTDGLTIVQDPDDPCADLDPQRVLGIAINLTSNKAFMKFGYQPGYDASGGKTEVAKLIGVYDVRRQNGDQSFQAVIPSHVPFEFHLIDSIYGLKLTDVRSWHSLQPRETRTDCGGCHQHELNKPPVPFAGTLADQNPPMDMVGATPYLDYTQHCGLRYLNDPQPTRHLPEWTTDIYPGLDLYCGSCHNSQQNPGNPPAVQAFGYTNESEAYDQLRDRNYANVKIGALGSPAFWAARGQRTDGRSNSDPKFQKDLANSDWGYYFSSIHASDPNLCGQSDVTKARWVYKLGKWIDNHMPRNRGVNNYDYHFDWYHPTADVAIATGTCQPTSLRIGYWDDTGSIDRLDVYLNGTSIGTYSNLSNGSLTLPVSGLINRDVIRVVVEDPTDNRQMYEKAVIELKKECQATDLVAIADDPIPISP